jgi:hypothetical protein
LLFLKYPYNATAPDTVRSGHKLQVKVFAQNPFRELDSKRFLCETTPRAVIRLRLSAYFVV